MIFTYAGERLEKSVRELAGTLERNDSIILPCDVTNDAEIETCFASIKEQVGVIHGIAHCIAFANKEELVGEYLNTNRDGFLLAHNISSYSLTAVVKVARPMMTEGGSIVTLTYLGGELVMPNYNVMGVAKASLDASVKYLAADLGKENIRVNSISAGPIRTLSAKGISDFNSILKDIEERAPLRRTTTPEEVGDTARSYSAICPEALQVKIFTLIQVSISLPAKQDLCQAIPKQGLLFISSDFQLSVI